MSITGPVPQETSIEAIDKVFQPKPKTKRNASQEVILTLSSTVERLDEQIAHKRAEDNSQHTEAKAAIMKALMQRNDTSSDSNRTHHLDGAPQTINISGGNVKLVIQEIAKRFRPFNVPPAPVAISDAEISAAEAEAAAAEASEEMQAKSLEVEIENQEHDPYIQQVVLNVHEQGEAEDDGFFTSHTAPTVEIEDSSAVQEILDPRHSGRVGRRRGGMYAISVKRQRRLKMKKHKYRKLMRKTRNIRRRLGQI